MVMDEIEKLKELLSLIINTESDKIKTVIDNGRLTIKQVIQFQAEINKFINKLNS